MNNQVKRTIEIVSVLVLFTTVGVVWRWSKKDGEVSIKIEQPASAVTVGGSVDDSAYAGLNAPSTMPRDDLRIVEGLITNFLTAHTSVAAAPIGFNEDLVAALTGKNPLGLVFLPASHPAINAKKQLCDRWGTAYFIHPVSATRLDVRSAGADRKLFTADDVLLTKEPVVAAGDEEAKL